MMMAHTDATPGVRAALQERWDHIKEFESGVAPESHFKRLDAPLIPRAASALERRRRIA